MNQLQKKTTQRTGEHPILSTWEIDKYVEKLLLMKNNFIGKQMQVVRFRWRNLDKITTQRRYANMHHTKSRRKANSGTTQRKGRALDLTYDLTIN